MKNYAILLSFPLVLLAFFLASCSSIPKQDERVEISYQCQEGFGSLRVVFYPGQSFAQLWLDGQELRLPQQITASGFWYSNGQYGLVGKGNEAWLEIGRRAPIPCQANP